MAMSVPSIGLALGIERLKDESDADFTERVKFAAAQFANTDANYPPQFKVTLGAQSEPPRDLYAVALPKSVQAEFDGLKERLESAEEAIASLINNTAHKSRVETLETRMRDHKADVQRLDKRFDERQAAPGNAAWKDEMGQACHSIANAVDARTRQAAVTAAMRLLHDSPGISGAAPPEERPATFACNISVDERDVDGWRNTDKIHERLGDLGVAISERWAEGKAKHGRKFQGWPMYHLQEELVDGVFYAMAAEHQLEAAISLLRRYSDYANDTEVGLSDEQWNELRDDIAEYIASLDE